MSVIRTYPSPVGQLPSLQSANTWLQTRVAKSCSKDTVLKQMSRDRLWKALQRVTWGTHGSVTRMTKIQCHGYCKCRPKARSTRVMGVSQNGGSKGQPLRLIRKSRACGSKRRNELPQLGKPTLPQAVVFWQNVRSHGSHEMLQRRKLVEQPNSELMPDAI